MRLTAYAHRLTTQLGGVLPLIGCCTFGNRLTGNALSINGIRQTAEVALDELVVTGMTLSSPPELPRPTARSRSAAAAGNWPPSACAALTGTRNRCGSDRSLGAGPARCVRAHAPNTTRGWSHMAAEGHTAARTGRKVVFTPPRRRPRPWLVGAMADRAGCPTSWSRAGRIHRELGFNVAMPVQPGTARGATVGRPIRHRPAGQRRGHGPGGVRGPGGDRVDRAAGVGDRAVRAVAGSAVAALARVSTTASMVALYTPILGLNCAVTHATCIAGVGRRRRCGWHPMSWPI